MCSKNKSAGCYLRCKWINGGYEISKASHYVLLVSLVDTPIHRLYLGQKKWNTQTCLWRPSLGGGTGNDLYFVKSLEGFYLWKSV